MRALHTESLASSSFSIPYILVIAKYITPSDCIVNKTPIRLVASPSLVVTSKLRAEEKLSHTGRFPYWYKVQLPFLDGRSGFVCTVPNQMYN